MIITEDHPAGLGGSIAPYGVPAATLQLVDPAGEARPLEEVENEVIRFAISHYRGQMSEVARRLRIGRSTLYRKLDLLGLNPDARETDNQSAVKAL
jgi:DNA-binding NtrC family response regulator